MQCLLINQPNLIEKKTSRLVDGLTHVQLCHGAVCRPNQDFLDYFREQSKRIYLRDNCRCLTHL